VATSKVGVWPVQYARPPGKRPPVAFQEKLEKTTNPTVLGGVVKRGWVDRVPPRPGTNDHKREGTLTPFSKREQQTYLKDI